MWERVKAKMSEVPEASVAECGTASPLRLRCLFGIKLDMSLSLLRQQLSEIIDGTKPGTPGLVTGIGALDAVLPNNGLPRGRLTELVGAPGSGKTTIVRQMVERAVNDGWWVAYVDAARTLTPRDWTHVSDSARDGLWVVRPRDAARGAWCADVLLRSGAFALVVLDGAPMLTRGVAVRLTRLARDSDAAFLVLGDDTKASELAGSLRLRVKRVTQFRRSRELSIDRPRDIEHTPASQQHEQIAVTVEKGGPYQTVNIGEIDRGIAVARRVRTHSEVPDRRGVARTQRADIADSSAAVSTRINARSRRAGEPALGYPPDRAH